jgi:glycosyltransferase involved in cell wall biosynthesis
MKLLLLDQFSDLGGAQQCLLELLPAFAAQGWHAAVGLPGNGELFRRVRALGFETETIECGPYASGRKSVADLPRFVSGTPKLARQIRDLAARMQADLVYVNGPRLLPAVALATLDVPVLFHAHSFLPPGPVRRLAGMALRRSNASVVGQCRFVAEPWRQYVRPERISVVYNGVAGPERLTPKQRHRDLRIGCLGRIAPEKGQKEFIQAAAAIHQAVPDSRFTIFGTPLFGDVAAARYEAEVREAAAGLPVEFAGWVGDVSAALADLDLLLVPSTAVEGTTRVILEAFAAALPVIAFASGGIPEVVEHGVNGLLPDSTEAMARDAIALLSGDGQRLAEMARAARDTWEKRFTLARYQADMLHTLLVAAGLMGVV